MSSTIVSTFTDSLMQIIPQIFTGQGARGVGRADVMLGSMVYESVGTF